MVGFILVWWLKLILNFDNVVYFNLDLVGLDFVIGFIKNLFRVEFKDDW